MEKNQKPLFIFELANNHNGAFERGVKIIRDIKREIKGFEKHFDFAFKLQYRHLETYIHPFYKNREDFKCIKKYNATHLEADELKALKDEIKKQGFIAICTAFDEKSVDEIEHEKYDYIKIASCSFCDWFLLDKIMAKNLPVIASCAAASFDDIDKVVKLFEKHNRQLALLHCVGEYPTENKNLQMNQIDLLKKRYPTLTIGFSVHDSAENLDNVKIAIAKGARIFEKHVGLDDYKGSLNAYSITPKQVQKWLQYAKEAYNACGIENARYEPTELEIVSLRNLSRGAFALCDIKKGEAIDEKKIFFAIPSLENQLLPHDFAADKQYKAKYFVEKNSPIFLSDTL